MFAEVGSVGSSRIAGLEAERVTTHEVVPLDHLLIIIAVASRPSGGVEETTKGVTTEVGAMGVKLSSKVIGGKVDEGLIDETDDLDVVGGLHVLNTPEGTGGDETGPVAGLGAPGDFLVLRLTDGGGTGGGSPETEI